MPPLQSFASTAASWQNFYVLVGTAAATLVGLMFVAITFGASLVSTEDPTAVRSFVDPTFSHFVQVLFTSCMLTMPSMSAKVLGGLLLLIGVARGSALFRVFRHMHAAHQKHNDIELSDWLSGLVLPLGCYLALAATAAGFFTGATWAFSGLAAVTVVILLNGVYGAWELMVWLALTRTRPKG